MVVNHDYEEHFKHNNLFILAKNKILFLNCSVTSASEVFYSGPRQGMRTLHKGENREKKVSLPCSLSAGMAGEGGRDKAYGT